MYHYECILLIDENQPKSTQFHFPHTFLVWQLHLLFACARAYPTCSSLVACNMPHPVTHALLSVSNMRAHWHFQAARSPCAQLCSSKSSQHDKVGVHQKLMLKLKVELSLVLLRFMLPSCCFLSLAFLTYALLSFALTNCVSLSHVLFTFLEFTCVLLCSEALHCFALQRGFSWFAVFRFTLRFALLCFALLCIAWFC